LPTLVDQLQKKRKFFFTIITVGDFDVVVSTADLIVVVEIDLVDT
jgi:hypothetical protein